jgi:hypothetical protein
LAGGSAGTIPYQSAAGTTVQLTAGTAGYILQANGAAAPSWVVASTAAGVNNGTLTMNVSGTGLSGSQTFTANQSSAATFTVTSNATNANTASTIVARDASGNFSAGTITATLSGNASTATSATTAGTITSQANSATITAATANTASTIVLRDASGNFSAGTITATLSGNASTATSATSATTASNATTAGGFTPSVSGGVASRIVVADGSGYINNTYFNSTDNSQASGVTAVMVKAGDNYYRSGTAAAVATFISGQTMNIAGSSTSCTGNAAGLSATLAVTSGGTGVTTSTGSGSNVLSTSPTLTTPVLGTPTSGNLSNCTADGTNKVGYLNMPQNAQTGSYTLVLADAGKHIYHASGAGAATYTIPANASVAYDIGTAVSFINLSATAISIAITTDTMYLSSAGTTGTRTLAQYGTATAVKVTSTAWIITGSGLT